MADFFLVVGVEPDHNLDSNFLVFKGEDVPCRNYSLLIDQETRAVTSIVAHIAGSIELRLDLRVDIDRANLLRTYAVERQA